MKDVIYKIPQAGPLRHLSHLFVLLMALLAADAVSAQRLTLRSFELSANDLSAMTNERRDLNGQRCALIRVQLPVAGCTFEGAKVGDVEFKVNEYWLYVPENTKRINIKCPGLETGIIVWETRIGNKYGVVGGSTYYMYLDGYSAAASGSPAVPARDGNYVVISLTPADASVKIDGKQQPHANDGRLSVYLSTGRHSYEVSAYGYATSTGVINMGAYRQSLNVTLTSVKARLALGCATAGVTFYVNDERVGDGSWSGELAAGVYRIEARKEGYRSQYRDLTLAENARESVSFPALTAVLASLDVNYEPIDAEVWLDGSRLGTSPGVWDVTAGMHTVELRSSGYTSEKRSVSIAEGQTVRLAGSLKSEPSSGTASNVSSASSLSSSSGKINGHEYVDLGLSVKWATCNVGANSPADYGNYYAWGETATKSKYTEKNSKTYGKKKMGDIAGNSSYDAARANWGGSWRLPTKAEFQELLDNCNSEWTTVSGVKGRKFTSKKNGKSIFLPAAGWRGSSLSFVGQDGLYWSATPHDTGYAYKLHFFSGSCDTNWVDRYGGYSVRAVAE